MRSTFNYILFRKIAVAAVALSVKPPGLRSHKEVQLRGKGKILAVPSVEVKCKACLHKSKFAGLACSKILLQLDLIGIDFIPIPHFHLE